MKEMTLSDFLAKYYGHLEREDFGKFDKIRCRYCGTVVYDGNQEKGKVTANCCAEMIIEIEKTKEEKRKQEETEAEMEKASKWYKFSKNLEESGLEGFELKAEFRNFRSRPELVEALNTCKEFTESEKTNLILSGTVGVGKTHIAVAAMKAIAWREQRTFSIMRCSSLDVKKDIFEFCKADVLVIDDIGRETGTDIKLKARRSAITEVIEYRHRNNKRTIYTTNMSSDEIIEAFGSHIFDRMLSNSLTCPKIVAESYRNS